MVGRLIGWYVIQVFKIVTKLKTCSQSEFTYIENLVAYKIIACDIVVLWSDELKYDMTVCTLKIVQRVKTWL